MSVGFLVHHITVREITIREKIDPEPIYCRGNMLIHVSNINTSSLFCSDLELKPVGVLEVKLVQARDLTNKDIVGKSDPFAELYIRPLRDRIKKSKTIVRTNKNYFLLFQPYIF